MKPIRKVLESRHISAGLIASAALVTMPLRTTAAETRFVMTMDVAQAGTAQEGASGSGVGRFVFSDVNNTLAYDIRFFGLSGGVDDETVSHIHGPALPGVGAGVVYNLPLGAHKSDTITLVNPPDGNQDYPVDQQVADLLAGRWYVNVHSNHSPGGEIRGQVLPVPAVPATSGLAMVAMAALITVIGVRTKRGRRASDRNERTTPPRRRPSRRSARNPGPSPKP